MMKKMAALLASSALIFTVIMQSSAQANDTPALLNITGTVGNSVTSCAVQLGQSSVNLISDPSTMVYQNEAIKSGTNVTISMTGPNQVYGSRCAQLAAQGRLAYKFVGTPDNADGNVLHNDDVSNGAAKGVGISIADSTKASEIKPLRINQDTLIAKSTPSTISLTLVKLNGQQLTSGSVKGSLTIQVERL